MEINIFSDKENLLILNLVTWNSVLDNLNSINRLIKCKNS